MQSFSIDGQTMRYLDVGQGEVIVFGHSYLWDSKMWQAQIESLSQHYRCIVPDFWGHGESDPHPQSMTSLNDYARHILALLDHLGIEQFSVAGLSFGGMWGVELVMLAPQRVKTLALLNTFVGLEPEVNCIKYNGMFELIRQAQCIPPSLAEQIVPLFFAQTSLDGLEEYVSRFQSYLAEMPVQQALEMIALGKMIFSRPDRFEQLEQFALPVLIISGAQDRSRTPLESYLMHDSITGSELHVLPDAGHTSAVESADEVTALLSEFFSRHLGLGQLS